MEVSSLPYSAVAPVSRQRLVWEVDTATTTAIHPALNFATMAVDLQISSPSNSAFFSYDATMNVTADVEICVVNNTFEQATMLVLEAVFDDPNALKLAGALANPDAALECVTFYSVPFIGEP